MRGMAVNGLFVTVVVLGITGHVLSQCQKLTNNLNYPSIVPPMCVISPKHKWDMTASETYVDLPKRENCNLSEIFTVFCLECLQKWNSHQREGRRSTEEKGQKRWTLDAICKETGIPKSTRGHRFNANKTGTRKGLGHIAGGKRQVRVLTYGKQAR